jgi:hypothetical protein
MLNQFNKDDLKTCRLSRMEIAIRMHLKYSTLCSKINQYIPFDPRELEQLKQLIMENQIKTISN